jgi:hypothetical protein
LWVGTKAWSTNRKKVGHPHTMSRDRARPIPRSTF